MIMDAELLFCEDKAVAASFTTDVVDLGKNGAVIDPLAINVTLTAANTSGKIDSVTLQSSATDDFATAVDEAAFYMPSTLAQTKPCVLAQFRSPVKPGNRYLRLKFAGTAPTGGKVTAFYTSGIVQNMH